MIDDFRDILTALVAADARFLIVGAHALKHASARSKDLEDIRALEG